MMEPITILIRGTPQPAGSKRSFALKKGGQYTGRVAVTDANPKSSDWKSDVRGEAQSVFSGELLTCPLKIDVTFTIWRPKSHYRSGKNADQLRDGAPHYPATKPDATKLLRGIEDALTGVVWKDDAQIVTQHVRKVFGTHPGAFIIISEQTP